MNGLENGEETPIDVDVDHNDPLRPAGPQEIAAAWQVWHSRHGGRIGPGTAFVEAINAAFAKRRKGMVK